MSDLAAHTLTVKVRRSGGRDRMGNRQPSVTHEETGCIRWPKSSTDTEDRSQQTATGWMLHLPPTADLLATDEVLFDGEPEAGPWWQVEGDPLPWGPSPFTGREPGIIVGLTRSAG